MRQLRLFFNILAFVFFISVALISCGGGGSSDNTGDSGTTGDSGSGGSPAAVDVPVTSDTPDTNTPAPSVPAFSKARSFNDNVNAVVAAADGSGDFYVAGEFTTYNNNSANRLIRLNSNGEIDTSFVTGSGFSADVNSLALAKDGSGDIYVGGQFISYNGVSVSGLVRLNSNGSLDTSFTTENGTSYTADKLLIAPGTSGDIYVGGHVMTSTSVVHNLQRLHADGSVDTTFNTGNAGLLGTVRALVAVGGNSTGIYVAGTLVQYNGLSVDHLIRLNADGSRDTAFNTGAGFSDAVYALAVAVESSGDIYVGGVFQKFNNLSRNKLLRLNSDGTLDSGFDTINGFAVPSNRVNSLIALADGSGDIYAGGFFNAYKSVFAVNALSLVRINNDGSIDAEFDMSTGFNGAVNIIESLSDNSGEIYVGGDFNKFKNTPINHLVRISNTATVTTDAAMTGTGFSGGNIGVQVIVAANDSSGDIYVGGDFTHYNGVVANRVIRLNSDGSIDTDFYTGSGFNNTVNGLAVAADGSGDLYVVGRFSSYNGISSPHIVRLNIDGGVDVSFNAGSGFDTLSIRSIVIARDASNDVYVGGDFTKYNAVATGSSIIRLNADGSKDAAFITGSGFLKNTPAGAGQIYSIVPLEDNSGDIYVAGNFNQYNSTAANHLIRLNSDGSVDSQLGTGSGFSSTTNNVVLTTDGSDDIYVSGLDFTGYNGTTGLKRIVRLNANGSIDTSFVAPGLTINYQVNDILLAADNSGDLYVGGRFGAMGPASTRNILRLNSDGSIDAGFSNNTGANYTVYALSVSADGSNDVFAGGLFTSYSTNTTDLIARLHADGTPD